MGTSRQAGAWLYAGLASGITCLPAVLLNLEADKRETAEHTRTKPDMVLRIFFFIIEVVYMTYQTNVQKNVQKHLDKHCTSG